MVTMQLLTKRFPKGVLKKLHVRNSNLYNVLRWISANAYELDLPLHLPISHVLNVENWTPYRGSTDNVEEQPPQPNPPTMTSSALPYSSPTTLKPTLSSPPLPPYLQKKKEIKDILDEQQVHTHTGGYQSS